LKTIGYSEGDIFAIVTDGFTDQIGGSTGKTSFGYRCLEEILKTNCAASAEEITAAMKCDFAAWQGTNARRDDVILVVFRL
jgi:serine phosphatase RsbU (regulator of sigma subunit)